MRIRFLSNTNIRSAPDDHGLPPLGVVFAGVEMEVHNRLYRGTAVEGVDTYFRDDRGWYYWTGRAVILYKALQAPQQDRLEALPGEDIGGNWSLEVAEEQQVPEVIAAPPAPEPLPAPQEAEKVDEVPPPPETVTELPAPEPSAPVAPPPTPWTYEPVLRHWGIDSLGIPRLCWEELKLFGEDIHIGLITTEVDDTHPDLAGRIVTMPADRLWNGRSTTGTSLAGLIAGAGRQQYLGPAPAARLYVAPVGTGMMDAAFDQLLSAVAWSLSQPLHILLFGVDLRADTLSPTQRKQLRQLVDHATDQGVVCIAPVGDGLVTRPEDRWPACLPDCLSVGALGRESKRLPGSLRSYTLGVMAPGQELVTGDASASSTAQAAAFTAGTLALLMDYARRRQRNLSASEWMQLLKQTAIPQYAATKCRDIEYGCGRINLEGMLRML